MQLLAAPFVYVLKKKQPALSEVECETKNSRLISFLNGRENSNS